MSLFKPCPHCSIVLSCRLHCDNERELLKVNPIASVHRPMQALGTPLIAQHKIFDFEDDTPSQCCNSELTSLHY